jgi:para-aminobenzoate synthetase component 1
MTVSVKQRSPIGDSDRQASMLPLVERLDPVPEPVHVFRSLARLPHVVFFDSAMRHPQLGRYSFVAADPVQWFESPADGSDALARLEARLQEFTMTAHDDLPPFQGGIAGMFGYELARGLDAVPQAAIDEFELPAMAAGLYDVVVAFDHAEGAAWIISQGWPETDPDARHDRAAARLAQFRHTLQADAPSLPLAPCPMLQASHLAPQFPVGHSEALTSNFSADGYREAVWRAIEYIYAGDVFQVNLSQRLLHPARESSVDLYCRLRAVNPAPFAGYLDLGEWQLCSASPERFLSVRHRQVETRPIKGTRSRGDSDDFDRLAAEELGRSEKDRAENVMIVDLLRNDLSRACRPESVRVSQLCGLESFASVHHLVSIVEGMLRDDCSPVDLLRACFPGGSVTGAPKVRAMEIIAELEPTVRGAYCGSLAYIGPSGHMDASILIRTLTAGGGWWQLPVGGGIVAQSDPQDEYEETWHKAKGLLQAIAD